MKIQNSSIIMAAAHEENSFTYKESMTMEAAKSRDVAGAILTLSQEGSQKSMKESMAAYQKQQEDERKQQQQENEARSLQRMAEQLKTAKTGNAYQKPEEDAEIKMLRQILAILRGEKIPEDSRINPRQQQGVLDLRSEQYYEMENTVSFGVAGIGDMGTSATGTTWQRITAVSGFTTETESTSFASTGVVQTADGRTINFNVEINMSRAFMQKFDVLETQEYIKTDPLMINLDTDIGSVSDQKFYFDLNADGKEEEISFAGKGSGFLALDRNGDGKINDGSELFGTASGDGFRDLAAYDEDGNGWIDENDSIFSKLKVWIKDENGDDHLIDLKKADVGAIYLGNADTQFSLKDDDNKLNGEIKKTGVYLKESSGEAGTLNHVDLVV